MSPIFDRKSYSRFDRKLTCGREIWPVGLIVVASFGTFVAAPDAEGSPWALPIDRLALTVSVDYSFATEEFLDARRAQPFPLEGFVQSTTFVPSLRYGLGRGWDVEASLPIKVVSYESDPVILLGPSTGSPGEVFDGFQENVLDFSQTQAGVADIELSLRKQWLQGARALATQIVVKIPAGYRGPAGTFGEFPETQDEFLANAVEFVRPGNIRDDVTLGDGQVDVTAWLHGGTATREGLFVRIGAGYRLRLDDAADQLVSEARLGQALFGRFVVYGGYRWAYSVEDGRLIGVSIAADDPELPATEYGGLSNLVVRELRLENDELVVSGGVIFKIFPRIEINVGYDRTVWGRNVSATNAFRLSIGYLVNLREE
ncbi:MAG: hypothetical protein HC923_00385 [Myxococcales bacterium]|nr:hypothetical protein [Myxococcales bacterium]